MCFEEQLTGLSTLHRPQQEFSPIPQRDLTLQSMVKIWSGDSSGPSVDEFLRSIELVAQTRNWSDMDRKIVRRLKTTGVAAACLDSHPELSKSDSTFSALESVLTTRFQGVEDPEQHFLAVNTIIRRSKKK